MKHSWLNNILKYRLLRALSRIYPKKVHFMPIGGIATDVILAAIGVQRNVWAQQHQQQLALVAIEALQGLIEGGKGGLLGEDCLEARA